MSLLALLLLVVAAPERVDLPLAHLTFKEDVRFVEGTRQLGDAFPYLAVQRAGETRPSDLTPATLGACLAGEITTPEAAYEAVRLFVAGVPVEDGKPLLEAAAKLRKEMRAQEIRFPHAAPASWKRSVEKTEAGWTVRFVAYEMDRILQLVSIRATVSRAGKVEIDRSAIVQGPMTVWQTAVVADGENGGLDREKAMRDDADLARPRFARALRAPRDLDTAFAIARLRLTPDQIEEVWPGERRVIGSGRKIVAVDLEGGTTAVYDATDASAPIAYLLHTRIGSKPIGTGKTLHRLAAQR